MNRIELLQKKIASERKPSEDDRHPLVSPAFSAGFLDSAAGDVAAIAAFVADAAAQPAAFARYQFVSLPFGLLSPAASGAAVVPFVADYIACPVVSGSACPVSHFPNLEPSDAPQAEDHEHAQLCWLDHLPGL